ncbi:MAG TPA: hypothetical protein VFR02_09985, partial [bacterium]|nr:hypothetical protein [bacterium]
MTPDEKPSRAWTAPLLFLAVAFVAFFPGLVLGRYYFANDLLAFSHGHLGLLKHDFAQGHLSLWNPFLFGGQPIFANPNYMRCNPLNYLIPLFPIPYGLTVYFFLHLFLAAFGAYLLLKTLRCSEGASRMGALLYGLSGDFWWEIIHPSILTVLALWPWLALTLETLSREWRPR